MLIHALIIAVALFCTVGFIGTIWSWLALATQPLHHWIDRAERDQLAEIDRELSRLLK